MISPGITLETSKVLLRPLAETDFEELLKAAQDKNMWYYFTVNLSDPVEMKKWMELVLREKASGTRRPFTIIEKASGRVAGSMSILNISYYDARAEIGSSWLGSDFRSRGINLHAKFSMMKHLFEEHRFERVEFKTDVENARARKGLQKIGGIEEGILRSHMQMWNNRRRTSIFYSVLKSEWKELTKTIFKDIK